MPAPGPTGDAGLPSRHPPCDSAAHGQPAEGKGLTRFFMRDRRVEPATKPKWRLPRLGAGDWLPGEDLHAPSTARAPPPFPGRRRRRAAGKMAAPGQVLLTRAVRRGAAGGAAALAGAGLGAALPAPSPGQCPGPSFIFVISFISFR